MERHFDNPKFRADAMRSLTDATNKLRHIVSRLSHPVNTLSGEFKMPRPTDLVPLLQRVLAQDGDPVRDTHEIEVKLPPSLIALADGERIEKVMENLLLNAIEAMADMPGKLTIEAGPAGQGKVFFSISDTGPGMSPEFIRDKLFRPFSTTKVRGVGLGLYTCREVVRANNGSIEVESKVASGTTFRVVLASAKIR
jgi:signal transduction histidine kinase